jgi:hypothetical protein
MHPDIMRPGHVGRNSERMYFSWRKSRAEHHWDAACFRRRSREAAAEI